MYKMTVKPDNGEAFTFDVDTRDLLFWERTNKGKSVGKLVENQSMVDFYSLAYSAAHRGGKFAGTLAEFETQCVLVIDEQGAGDDDEEEAGPLEAGQSAA